MCVCVCVWGGGPVVYEELLRLYGLGLWLNGPIRGW